MRGDIKAAIREREVEGKPFKSGTVPVRYLYPFALGGVSSRKLE